MPADETMMRLIAAIAADGEPAGERASRIAQVIRDACGHRWVGVYEVTETEVAILGYAGPGSPAHPRFARTQGLTAAAIERRQTVVVDDVTTDPRYLTAFGSTRSEMIVPVFVADGTTVIGTIDVESDHVAAFDIAERDFVEGLAEALRPLYTTR
jgi:GAF domain-containing protein